MLGFNSRGDQTTTQGSQQLAPGSGRVENHGKFHHQDALKELMLRTAPNGDERYKIIGQIR